MPLISYDANLDMVRIDGFHKGAIEIYAKHSGVEHLANGTIVFTDKPRLWAFQVRFTSKEGGPWRYKLINSRKADFKSIRRLFWAVKEKAPSFHQGPRGVRYSAR